MDGILALDLWDVVIEVLRSSNNSVQPNHTSRQETDTLQCKKQTSVSLGSTESKVISSDAGLRMDGLPALDLCDLVIEASHSFSIQPKARGNRLRDKHCEKHSNERTKKQSNTSEDFGWKNIDYVT